MWQLQALVRDSPLLTKLANSPLYPLIYVVQQFLHLLFMGYSLVPFCLFTYDKWLKVSHNSLKGQIWWDCEPSLRQRGDPSVNNAEITRSSKEKQHWNQCQLCRHWFGMWDHFEMLTNQNKHCTCYPPKSTLGVTSVCVCENHLWDCNDTDLCVSSVLQLTSVNKTPVSVQFIRQLKACKIPKHLAGVFDTVSEDLTAQQFYISSWQMRSPAALKKKKRMEPLSRHAINCA